MSPERLRVAHLASEMAPFVKVGGLADVVGALSAEQARRGHRVTVVIPAYRTVAVPEGWSREELPGAEVPWGLGREPARFELLTEPGSFRRVLLVHHAGERRFFDRPGVYDEPGTGQGYTDNAERFLFFARAALEGLHRLDGGFDVLHAHDQQAAWVPCFVRTHEAQRETFRGVATAFTIHNLGYQGIYDSWVLGLAGFPGELFYPSSPFEFWGRVNYMKVGLSFADVLSTVSPRYAEEIQSGDEFGFGLEGVLKRRAADLSGILNGIDDETWNPATDPHLPHGYDADHLEDKQAARAALARACGFPLEPDWPIVGMISRLVEQKGFDLVEQARKAFMRLRVRLVVLGYGQPRFQELFEKLARDSPQRVHFAPRQDEGFAHLVEGGSDIFLMPSRYEPCGLNQMYSLRYGTVPVVRATGGLADTVREYDRATGEGTGFCFERYEAEAMMSALKRALAMWRQPRHWQRIQRNGMSLDLSWRTSADGYDQLYREARERVAEGRVQTMESVRAAG